MKRPFTFIIIPLILGIIISYKIQINIYILLAVLIIMSIALIVSLYKKGYSFMLFFTMIILGSFLTSLQLSESKLLKFENKYVELEGIVKESISKGQGFSTYRIDVGSMTCKGKRYIINEKSILKSIGSSELLLGDKVVVEGIIHVPKENTNPRLFDYRLYLQTKNIFTTISTKVNNLDVLSTGHLSKAEKVSQNFRNNIDNLFDKSLDSSSGSFMKAMIMGESSYLDESTENRYREIGLAHVLAVSGLHIGIISLFLIYLLGFIGFRRRLSVILTLSILWIYGYFVGYPISVLRALIMFSFLMLAGLLYRRYDPMNIISLVGCILLIYNPLWIFSVGLQFSFSATISLMLFTTKIQQYMFNKYKKIGHVLSPLIAVQLGIFPIMVYHFNDISTLSIFTNLILVPLISIALIVGFVMSILSIITIGLMENILDIIGYPLSGLLYIVDFIARILHKIPFNQIILPSPTVIEILLFYIIVFLILRIIKIKILSNLFGESLIKCILIYLYISILISGIGIIEDGKTVTIDFLDVGQGDCVIIRTNGKSFLIDSGGTPFSDFDIGESVIIPYIRKEGIRKLNGAFISHFHADHCEGYISLLNKVEIDNLFIGYENHDNELFAQISEIANKHSVDINVLNSGDELILGKQKNIKILNPQRSNKSHIDDNNMSLVMLLEIYDRKVLFTGDIEKEVEESIIKNFDGLNIDILKVPHHGSVTSSSLEFIANLQSEYAVIQVGNNNFGHPSDEVLERFNNENIKTYRNDNDGMIKVTINKNKIKIQKYLPTRKTFGNFLSIYNLQLTIILIFLIICTFINLYYKRLLDFERGKSIIKIGGNLLQD